MTADREFRFITLWVCGLVGGAAVVGAAQWRVSVTGSDAHMFKTLFHVITYWVPALLIILLVLARAVAPYPYRGPDYTQSVTESLVTVARELSDKHELYVEVDGHDPESQMLADLNDRKLPPTFTPWSARSPALDHCRPKAVGEPVSGTCMQDNFLAAQFLSMPLWHVALVRVKTAACAAELTLVGGATQWHVISQRASCS